MFGGTITIDQAGTTKDLPGLYSSLNKALAKKCIVDGERVNDLFKNVPGQTDDTVAAVDELLELFKNFTLP